MAAIQPPVARTSIEFVVKPKQDLYLEGSLRRIPRVLKGSVMKFNFMKL